ncbi:MAG: DNA polymerase IV [Candidatus Latescibacterota bacterium]
MSSPRHSARKVIHVDMDAFFASVEQRDRPELRGQPVVVGGAPEERGVVAAASYEARRFGVRSAMPMRTALRLCPQVARVPADFRKYGQVSAELHGIFRRYTDLIEPVSLDEAYLDVTANKPGLPYASEVARLLKEEIRATLRLTASAGVAPNKFLAKVASDLRKPDGLVVVRPEQVEAFLADLPVDKVPGVGRVTQQQLAGLEVHTMGQLAGLSRQALAAVFGRRGMRFWELARGLDDEPVTPERDPQQVSQETTFAADLHAPDEMLDALRDLAVALSARARRHGLKGRTVTLKVRYPDFRTVTRSRALQARTDEAVPILQEARELLARTEAAVLGVRLLGVGLSGLTETNAASPAQLDLFG